MCPLPWCGDAVREVFGDKTIGFPSCSLLLTCTQGVKVTALPGGMLWSGLVRARPVGLAVGGEGNTLDETSKRTGFICLRPPNVRILRGEARQQLPGVPALPEGAACLGVAT